MKQITKMVEFTQENDRIKQSKPSFYCAIIQLNSIQSSYNSTGSTLLNAIDRGTGLVVRWQIMDLAERCMILVLMRLRQILTEQLRID